MPTCSVLAAAVLPIMCAFAFAANGEVLFVENCVACHQADGGGTPGLAPPLVSETMKNAGTARRDYGALVIIHGLSGPIKVKGQQYVSAMPPRADFSDEDVAALANYVAQDLNGLNDDQYEPLAAADINELRKAATDHRTLRDLRAKFGE